MLVERLDPDFLTLRGLHLHVFPTRHLHAKIGPGADGFHDGARVVSSPQNIDALAEELAAHHPLVGSSQQDERGREQRKAQHVDVGADGNVGVNQKKGRKNKAVETEHQQDAEVNLQAAGDDARLVQVEVVRENQAHDGDDGNLEHAVLVLQRNVGCRREASSRSRAESSR